MGCLSASQALYAQTSGDINAAARRLEAAFNSNNSAQIIQGGSQPRWVNDPYTAYNRENFFAAIGSGPNRNEAETKALAALAGIFGQSIRTDFSVSTIYTEALNRGVISVSENTSVNDQITTAVSMDRLVGAEIGYVWDSGRGIFYAAAYLDKAKTVSIYSDMIIINNRNIDLLITMNNTEKNTFNGLSRYKLAANIAGINANYASIITLAGGSVSSLNIKSADFYILEAADIIKNITITINVNNDRANRVQNAFAQVLSSEGFRTTLQNNVGGTAYTLEVRLNTEEVRNPGNNFIFCSIQSNANLIENSTGASLFPFSFNVREGHTTYANAESRAFTMAEREITQKYSVLLREYLSSLIPK